MFTAIMLVLAALGVCLLLYWAYKDGPPAGDNWLAEAEDAEKKIVSNARSSAASFRNELSAHNVDPNKPKA